MSAYDLIAAFLTGGLGWVLGHFITARPIASNDEQPRIEVRDDLRNLPPGSVVAVSYDAVLSKEQRQALKSSIEYQVGEGVKVIVLEAGLKIEVVSGLHVTNAPPSEPARRRDDNRSHHEPSEPWN